MILSPYHTRHGSALSYLNIQTEIIKHIIIPQSPHAERVQVADGLSQTFRITDTKSEVPLFTQTMPVYYRNTQYVFIDDRQSRSMRRELLLNEIYIKLTSVWLNDNKSIIQQSTILAGRVFVNVLTNVIMNKYRVTLQDTVAIKLACAMYYAQMYGSDIEEYKMVRSLKQYTGFSSTIVEEFIRSNPTIADISELARVLSEIDNPALRNVSDVSLWTIMSGVYYGLNSKEHIAVGLEYIPRWVSLVALTLQDAGFNRTLLGATSKKLESSDEEMLPYLKQLLGH